MIAENSVHNVDNVVDYGVKTLMFVNFLKIGINTMLKNLNSEQKNILASIRQGMDFAADIAHACITVYLASDDKRFLRVYHQSMPKTQFLQQPELAPGREVRISEEPLIARCLQRNVPLEGKRELSLWAVCRRARVPRAGQAR